MYIPYDHKIYQPFAFQDPPTFSQIRIFGLKIYDLANPVCYIFVRPKWFSVSGKKVFSSTLEKYMI
jgi:hypothetical protein